MGPLNYNNQSEHELALLANWKWGKSKLILTQVLVERKPIPTKVSSYI